MTTFLASMNTNLRMQARIILFHAFNLNWTIFRTIARVGVDMFP